VYQIGPDDRAVEVDEIPSPEPGAPLPHLELDERGVRLIYYLAESWRVSHGLDGDKHVAICRFNSCSAVYFGVPSDEALLNHPLYGRGLGFYGAFRVERSSWAAALSEVGSRKDAPAPRMATPKRTHWIITMHDSTFECVAGSVTVDVRGGAMTNVIAELRSD
jgi:hypothetical protein